MRPLVVCFSGPEGLVPDRRERLARLLPEADVLDPVEAGAGELLQRPFVALSWGDACGEAIDAADRWLEVGRDVRWVVLVAPPRLLVRHPHAPCTIVVGARSEIPRGVPNARIVRLEDSLADRDGADIEVTGVVAAGLLAIF